MAALTEPAIAVQFTGRSELEAFGGIRCICVRVRASQHPLSEPDASPAETQAGTAATQDILNQFVDQLFQLGRNAGLTMDQILDLYNQIKDGQLHGADPTPKGK